MDIQSTLALITGVISTSIAIYQWAVINESKKRRHEFQFLLAGINSAALQKQQTWANQISSLKVPLSDLDWEKGQIYVRARDDAGEIVGLTVALEGTIDTESSAITAMMDKSIEIVKKNNILQSEGLKNPQWNQGGEPSEVVTSTQEEPDVDAERA